MQAYADINNDSGVVSFELGDDYIIVMFKGSSKVYTYSYASAGAVHVEKMKQLALNGDGLNSYIMKNVRNSYEH